MLRFRAAEDEEVFAAPIIISNAAYIELIETQLAEIGVEACAILLEPEGKNTAAVAALAARFIAGKFPGGLGLLLPSDHYIGQPSVFINAIRKAAETAQKGYITTFGIAVSRPETGFGYIHAGSPLDGPVSTVAAFREKPDSATAASYLAAGDYSWNAGIFLFEADTLLIELEAHAPDILEISGLALSKARHDGNKIFLDPGYFTSIRSTSIDYAIMEKTHRAAVYAPLECAWSDIGTWAMIGDVSDRANSPEAISVASGECLVHAAEGILVALVGVENLIVVADGNRVLITTKERSQDVGKVVQELRARGLDAYL
ncbi:mannose-1-phosphate guanylyltransferase [Hyphomonas hirschiana VP5]|uniref:Mannose-1-phosphate guanylyltransferase n=1 Tax=Hyphomonas hirschiana VP5 TaxID=1280951 RepID=A0A059G038_9PROT|nr:mannose-1-phosphate guanylyltransferase [Hyphomonas hirschiana VP5]